jgi:hypothetical protein
MSNPLPTTGILLLDILLSLVGSGALLIGIANIINDRSVKKRSDYIELSKYKIEQISNYKPLILNQARFFKKLFYILSRGQDNADPIQALFVIGNILKIDKEINNNYGFMQLDNLHAEEVLNHIRIFIINEISIFLKPEDPSRIISLVTEHNDFHQYYKIVETKYYDLLEKIHKFIYTKKFNDIKNYSSFFSELIIFEMNHIYKLWYKKTPRYLTLSKELRKHIENQSNMKIEVKENMTEGELKKLEYQQQIKHQYQSYNKRIRQMGFSKFKYICSKVFHSDYFNQY